MATSHLRRGSVIAEQSSAANAISARQRRQVIRQAVVDRGFVRIDELAQTFDVSVMTIHRDLDLLESEGWLRKVRAGATAQPSEFHHGDVGYRAHTMGDAKRLLAAEALQLISPGQAIMIDDSTTALTLADRLPEREPLTVITNFLAGIKRLAGEPGIDLVALGGAYYPAYDAFLGMRTCEAIETLRADYLFMSTTAVTGGQCYHQSQETVLVKRALMKAAAKKVLLIDHTKFEKNGLHQLAPLTDFDLVIIDPETPERHIRALESQGVTLLVAGASSSQN